MRVLAVATMALRRIVDLALVLLILTVVAALALSKGAPLVGRQSIVIGGGSMEPAIPLGSAIIVRPLDPATLAVGDVVSMRVGPGQAIFTHRVIAVIDRTDGRWVQTRGDANAEPDPTLVPVNAILGRVEVVVPMAGYLIALLSLPLGVLFALGVAATLLAVAWLLESLEPEPRHAGSVVPRAGDPRPTTGTVDGPPLALAPELVVDRALARGEPIADRAGWVDLAAASMRGIGSPARGSRPVVALAGEGVDGGPSVRSGSFDPRGRSAARPTVREQLDRSRDVRRRRLRWLAGDRSRAED